MKSKYFGLNFTFGDKKLGMFSIPRSFVETGSTLDLNLDPKNFFGVDLTAVLKEQDEQSAKSIKTLLGADE